MNIATLSSIVPPPSASEEPSLRTMDWNSKPIEFPEDYKQFIDIYGGGQFQGELSIAPPAWILSEREAGSASAAVAFLRDTSIERPDYVKISICSFGYSGEVSEDEAYGRASDSYLWIGFAGTGQNLFWRTLDEHNPSEWPVVATDGAGIDYAPGGLIAYLSCLLSGECSSEAFGDDWATEFLDESRPEFRRVNYGN